MNSEASWHLRTRAVAAGRPHEPGQPLNTPIIGASSYQLGGGRTYARAEGTPTWEALEQVVAALEGGPAVAFASGMGAVSAVLELVAPGGRVAAPSDCYLGTGSLLREGDRRGRWSVSWLDPDETDRWADAAENHDMLWLESPTNPLLRIMDLPPILSRAREAACVAVVDNTFATPLGQQPLALGADIAVHSATKYLSGHSDLMLGVAAARDEATAQRLRERRMLLGATPGMLEAFLVTRGMRTLALRMDAACRNAGELAQRLSHHAGVQRVRYPGLDRPLPRFMMMSGAMVSFDMRGGSDAADRVCRAVRLIRHATSLGGVESTMERRGALPGQGHLPPGLIRLSVGCEDVDDLWSDLVSALASA